MKVKEKQSTVARADSKEFLGHFQGGVKRALKEGIHIVEPEKNQIQLDLDGIRAMHRYSAHYTIFKKAGLTKGWKEKLSPSKSGGSHVHVTITMREEVDNVTRVMLQAVLGSDLLRETFNATRVLNKNKYPIVFFESGRAKNHI